MSSRLSSPLANWLVDHDQTYLRAAYSLWPNVRASDMTSDHLLSAGTWPASSCMRITPESSTGNMPHLHESVASAT
jgi:hypothetical protein